MGALAVIFALAVDGTDLPRDLAEELSALRETQPGEASLSPLTEPEARRKVELVWSIGGHLGVASSFDSDDAAFDVGAQGRLNHLFPWLSVEASLDLQTEQSYESGDIHVFLFPVQFSALFHAPVDWPVKPYGVAGVGVYFESIHYSGALGYHSDQTAIEPGIHVGVGADYELSPQIFLNADLRFVFLSHPGGLQGNDLNYLQFSVGVNFLLK